ncbi:MAG TPA: prolyl oligopeptidase family serine peptidase [Mucilaginibacter sp.]|nr:prolyl oligopeptidase family serine peptidase [Mucilaginibacter sp.]
MKKYYFFVLLIALCYPFRLHAQETAQTFLQQTNYLLYLPEHYADDTSARWPLVLFLHGSGEVGDSIQWVARNGPPKLAKAGKKFPFILVSPQSTAYRWYPNDLMSLLSGIKKQYRVDNERIYLTGLSMGGFGTWAMAEQYPDEFAAIPPLSGGGDSTQAWKLRYLPVWCFHGLKDNVVPPSNSIDMMRAVRQFNPGAKLTLYPETGHDSWTTTYDNDTVYTWMLAQHKSARKRVLLPVSVLNDYCGAYVGKGTDTVYLTVKDDAILATSHDNTTLLIPAKKDLFFMDEHSSADACFERDTDGEVSKLVVLSSEREIYIKIPKK